MYGIDTLGQLFARFGPREYPTGSGAESVDHEIVFAVFEQQNETRGKVQGLDRPQNRVPGEAAVSQHAADEGYVWLRSDDFVRYCFGSESNRQDGFKAQAAATLQLPCDQLGSHPGSITNQNAE
jgi:hypothetical protein